MSTKKQKKETIRLQILKSESNGFELSDISKDDISKLQQKDLNFNVTIHIASNLKKKQLKLETVIEASQKSNQKLLFKIKATSIFHSPDIRTVINENNAIIAPEDFMRKIINISIGGARGMLAVHLADTKLKHITLPLLDTGSLKEEK